MEKNKKNIRPAGESPGASPRKRESSKSQRKHDPVANQGSGSEKAQSERAREKNQQGPSPTSSEWQRPVTNQDEQRNPTNEGGVTDAGIKEEEKEGDSNLRKIDPYKNIGNDSKEVEKKEPVD